MGHEIEAKLKYEKHEDLKKVLEGQGAAFAGDRIQRDIYFDDAMGSLKAKGIALRLREERDVKIAAAGKAIITMKGPLEDSRLKKRNEVNLEVAGCWAAEELLTGLGYRKVMAIEKKRSAWHLGGCEVAMDELPLIGRFVEIEGPDENAVGQVQARLGLGGLEHIPRSYTALVAKEMRRRGIDMTDVTFDEPA